MKKLALIALAIVQVSCRSQPIFTSDEFRSQASDFLSTWRLILDTSIDNPDTNVANAVSNIAAIALNQPMDRMALDLWLDRLGRSIDRTENSELYSNLRSGAEQLRASASGSTGSTDSGSGSNENNNPTPTTTESQPSGTPSTVATDGINNSLTTGTIQGTATSTSKPRGLPFQPRESDSSAATLGLSGFLILLFF